MESKDERIARKIRRDTTSEEPNRGSIGRRPRLFGSQQVVGMNQVRQPGIPTNSGTRGFYTRKMPVLRRSQWGRCPRCESALLHPECASCGWGPEELLKERLQEIERVRRGEMMGVTDPDGLAEKLAAEGVGATGLLLQLGALDSETWRTWINRFWQAAGVTNQPWSGKVSGAFEEFWGEDGGNGPGD